MAENPYSIDTSTPAVVLKFDPNVMHHGGLGVIRSLGRIGVPVYGVHEGPWAPAASSRYLAGRFFWQPRPDDVDRVLTGLHRLAERIGQRSVLLATDDAGAIFLAEHGHGLRSAFLFPDPPAHLPRRLAGKYSLFELCRELGFSSPATVTPGSFRRGAGLRRGHRIPADRQAHHALDQGQRAPQYLGPGQPGGSAARLRDLRASRGRADAAGVHPGRPGPRLVLPRVLRCRLGLPPAFTGIKERSYPADAGLTSLGRSAANEALRDEVTTLLTKLGYRGILDLDIRLDERTGEYHLLDFNPRLGAQFRVFRDTAGTDVALAAYLDLTDQPLPPGSR